MNLKKFFSVFCLLSVSYCMTVGQSSVERSNELAANPKIQQAEESSQKTTLTQTNKETPQKQRFEPNLNKQRMEIKIFVFNPFQENTYLISTLNKECLVIDPGCLESEEKNELANYIIQNGLTLKRVINTHLHLDHAFGCNFLAQKFGIQAEASQKDEPLLDRIKDYSTAFGLLSDAVESAKLGGYLKEGDVIELGDLKFEVLENPGHSLGGLIFLERSEGVAFVGDSIFKGSVGRTDLPGGNHKQLIENLRKNILTLPKETVLYPGHGPSTTVDWERCHNPYLE